MTHARQNDVERKSGTGESRPRVAWLCARLWPLSLTFLFAMGCGREDPAAPGRDVEGSHASVPHSSEPLRIAAASDLQLALPALAKKFQADSGITISSTFLASGQLAEQIKQGAPFDVFMAANQSFVKDLAGAGFVKPESVRTYARGSLVLAVFRELGGEIRSLADLTKPAVKKLALANPETAPYGKAGKEALVRAGLWEALQPKIVFAGSVRQALLYAQKGDAEAAFVGRAIARVPEIQAVDVDPKLYDPIIQALGIVAATNQAGAAGRFVTFILSEEGQGILKDFGFAPPPAEPSQKKD
jgi:molybdate transport system substrate-binding protein